MLQNVSKENFLLKTKEIFNIHYFRMNVYICSLLLHALDSQYTNGYTLQMDKVSKSLPHFAAYHVQQFLPHLYNNEVYDFLNPDWGIF